MKDELFKAMEMRGYTWKRFCDEFPCSKGTLSRIKNGKPLSKVNELRLKAWIIDPDDMTYREMEGSFICPRCLAKQDNESRYRNIQNDYTCKLCHAKRVREYRRTDEGQKAVQGYQDKWRENNRERYLECKQNRYYNDNYGEFSEVAKLTYNLKQELNNGTTKIKS